MRALRSRLRLTTNPAYAAVGLYVFSILWWLLFPLISITTGELKPRGLYVDENALLVNSASLGFREVMTRDAREDDLHNFQLVMNSTVRMNPGDDNICLSLTKEFASVTCRGMRPREKGDRMMREVANITQIVVDHPWKPRSLEVSMVVVSYHSSNELQTFGFTTVLIKKILSADWLSKRIIILLLPLSSCARQVNCTDTFEMETFKDDSYVANSCKSASIDNDTRRFSKALSTWLNEYHSIGHNQYDKVGHRVQYEGLLRDAYVIDFTEPLITSTSSNSERTRDSIKDGSMSRKVSWEKILLSTVGNNGQLPNMDFLTAPLASFPHITSNEADIYLRNNRRNKFGHLGSKGGEFSRELEKEVVREGLISICRYFTFVSASTCHSYFEILSGLTRFSSALIHGPSGLHGQFIRRNIDSLTLRPIKNYGSEYQKKRETEITDSVQGAGMGIGSTVEDDVEMRIERRAEAEIEIDGTFGVENNIRNIPRITTTVDGETDNGDSWAGGDLIQLISMVEYLLRLSSNLHEELHHSHWFYIIMGSKTFVGLSEYAPTVPMAMAPLLFLYIALAYALNSPQSEGYESSEDCKQIHETVHSEKLCSVMLMTASSENFKENVDNAQAAYVRWPLITGYYMFIIDNAPTTLVVVLLQPYLGTKYVRVGSDLVLIVFGCTSAAIIVSRIMEARYERYANITKSNTTHKDCRQDLTGYCVVLTLTLILVLLWIAAQHYSLAFPLILLLVPTVNASCLCGVSLDVLSVTFIHSNTRTKTDEDTNSSRLDKIENINANLFMSTNQDDVSDIHSGKEEDVEIDAEINIVDKILTHIREEDASHPISEDTSLSGCCTQTMDTSHENEDGEAGREEVEVHRDQEDFLFLSTSDADQHGGIENSQSINSTRTMTILSKKNDFISDSRNQLKVRRKRVFCCCVLVFLCAACSPLCVQIVLFFLKLSCDYLLSPTSFSSSSSTFFWSDIYGDSSLYLRGFLLDWIEPEISSLAYPVFLLLPQMISFSCLRILLAYTLKNVP